MQGAKKCRPKGSGTLIACRVKSALGELGKSPTRRLRREKQGGFEAAARLARPKGAGIAGRNGGQARRAPFRRRKLCILRNRLCRFLTRAAAPPLPTKPASLGFGGGPNPITREVRPEGGKKERHPFGWRSV